MIVPDPKDVARNSLTAEQVAAMEEALTRHYGYRVTTVEKYCQGFYDWQKAIEDKVKRLKADDPMEVAFYSGENAERSNAAHKEQQLELWQGVLKALHTLYLPIVKSCLLNRLIYMGEPLRTQRCPHHKGHWLGYALSSHHQCECSLDYADITGWLPESKPSLDKEIALFARDREWSPAEFWHGLPDAPGYEPGKQYSAEAGGHRVLGATYDEAIVGLAKLLAEKHGFESELLRID